MSIDTPERPGFKDVFNLVRKSPALLVTGIIGVLVVGYIIVKNSQQNATPATPDTLAQTTSPGGYDNAPQQTPQPQPIIIIPTPVPAPSPVPTPTPTPVPTPTPTPSPGTGATVPSTSQDDIVRTRYGNPSVAGYDKTHSQGVPIRSGPNTSDTVRYAAYGSKINITGPAVAGSSNLGKTDDRGTQYWYPVAGGGYISAFDVQSSYPAASTSATVPSNS